MKAAAIGLLLLMAAAAGASPFDGVWVADLDTQAGLATDEYLVLSGEYRCLTCAPPRAYRADGRPRTVPGDREVTLESVTIAGPRTIVTHIVAPLLDRVTTMTVAPDDRTATYVSIDHRPGIAAPLRTEYLARRVGPAPAGAHPVSGRWQGVRYIAVPAPVRTTVLRLAGDRFSYTTPLGTSFDAQFGGGEVPVGSRQGVSDVTVRVRRAGPRQIEECAMRTGRLILVRTFTVSPDGRSLVIATTDPKRGTTFRATSRRTAG